MRAFGEGFMCLPSAVMQANVSTANLATGNVAPGQKPPCLNCLHLKCQVTAVEADSLQAPC